jgi:hypothetical protein
MEIQFPELSFETLLPRKQPLLILGNTANKQKIEISDHLKASIHRVENEVGGSI